MGIPLPVQCLALGRDIAKEPKCRLTYPGTQQNTSSLKGTWTIQEKKKKQTCFLTSSAPAKQGTAEGLLKAGCVCESHHLRPRGTPPEPRPLQLQPSHQSETKENVPNKRIK